MHIHFGHVINIVSQTYQQRVGGVRVYGGDFKLTLSLANQQHPQVLNTHGSPLTEPSLDTTFNGIDVAQYLSATPPDATKSASSVHTYLSQTSRLYRTQYATLDVQEVAISTLHSAELVWSVPSASPGGIAQLVYYIQGSVSSSSSLTTSVTFPPMRFYAFLCTHSHAVLQLVSLIDQEVDI